MDSLQKAIQEAINCYKYHRKVKPFIDFSNFLESLERKENKTLIESIQKGLSVIIENSATAARLNPEHQEAYNKSDYYINDPEGKAVVAQAEKNPAGDKPMGKYKETPKMVLLHSVIPAVGKELDRAMNIWDPYTAFGDARGDQMTEEAMSRAVTYILSSLLPHGGKKSEGEATSRTEKLYAKSKPYDPQAGTKFITHVISQFKSPSDWDKEKKRFKNFGYSAAKHIVMDVLQVRNADPWVPENERSNKSKYAYIPTKSHVDKGRVLYGGKLYTRLGPDKHIPDKSHKGIPYGDIPPDHPVVRPWWGEYSEDISPYKEHKHHEGAVSEKHAGTGSEGEEAPLEYEGDSPEEEFEQKEMREKAMNVIKKLGFNEKLTKYLLRFYLQFDGKPTKEEHIQIANEAGFDLSNNTDSKALSRAREKAWVALEKLAKELV